MTICFNLKEMSYVNYAEVHELFTSIFLANGGTFVNLPSLIPHYELFDHEHAVRFSAARMLLPYTQRMSVVSYLLNTNQPTSRIYNFGKVFSSQQPHERLEASFDIISSDNDE